MDDKEISAVELFGREGFRLQESSPWRLAFVNERDDIIEFDLESRVWFAVKYVDFDIPLTRALVAQLRELEWI